MNRRINATPKIPDEISPVTFQKLFIKKQDEGLGDKSWAEYFRYLTRDVSLDRTVNEVLHGATRDNLAKMWMENFADNLDTIRYGKKLYEMKKITGPALVVGAGPSVQARQHLPLLAEWVHNNPGTLCIVTTDRMLVPCLKAGINPDVVMTVDGDRKLIAKFYEDPILDKASLIQGAALPILVAPSTVKTIQEKGVEIYWFTPMLDSFDIATNITKLLYWMTNGATAVLCGGNAGTGSWQVARYLGATEVALIGLDFGYLPGTPIEETAYYNTLKDQLKGSFDQIRTFYADEFNPDFQTKAVTDIMFRHYRSGFIEMLDYVDTPTYNCTEGGILYGGKFKSMKLADWLKRHE